MANLKTIVDQVATTTETSKKETEALIRATFDAIINTVIAEGDVSIPGFGIFHVVEGAPRTSLHPVTGETINTPATKRLKLKVSSTIKAQVKGE